MNTHSAYVAALAQLSKLGGELIEAVGSDLPHGDRMDAIAGIVSHIQEALTDAQAAFDAELPFLPKS